MQRILIDTDVILDFFFDRRPFVDDAAAILALCELKKISGFVTPVIVSNVYYLLRQGAKHDKVIQKLTELMTIIDVLSIDKQVIQTALTSDFKEFEDALQNYAAAHDGTIDCIVTRNVKDFKNSSLSVMTPDTFLSFYKSRIH